MEKNIYILKYLYFWRKFSEPKLGQNQPLYLLQMYWVLGKGGEQ